MLFYLLATAFSLKTKDARQPMNENHQNVVFITNSRFQSKQSAKLDKNGNYEKMF